MAVHANLSIVIYNIIMLVLWKVLQCLFNVADKTAFCILSKTWVVFHPTSDCTLIFVSFDHPPSTAIMMMMTMMIKLKLNGLLWPYFWFFLKQWNDSLNKKIRLRRCKSGTARWPSVIEHHSMCSILCPMRDQNSKSFWNCFQGAITL